MSVEQWELDNVKEEIEKIKDSIWHLSEVSSYIGLIARGSWLLLDTFPFTRNSPLHFRGYYDGNAQPKWVASLVYLDNYGDLRDQCGRVLHTQFTHWCWCPTLPSPGD